MRVKSTITLDQELLKLAHDLGLNVSKTCEDALQIRIQALQQARTQESNGLLTPGSSAKKLKLGMGVEPTLNSSAGSTMKDFDWDAFRRWVCLNRRPRWASYIVRYSQRFGDCLIKNDLGPLQELSDSNRPNAMKALSALSKYLGLHDQFNSLVKDYDLKWRGRDPGDLLIDRLNRDQDSEEVFRWIRQVRNIRGDYSDFMDLMATTGLRLGEGVESFNLIVRLSHTNELNTYYSPEKEALEHFRFRDLFIRRNKKAFMSFVHKSLLDQIAENPQLPSAKAIEENLKRRKMICRFGDVREVYATLMTKYLRAEEIDFLQGRVPDTVFAQHYFNPSLIGDLRTRALKGIDAIMEKVAVD